MEGGLQMKHRNPENVIKVAVRDRNAKRLPMKGYDRAGNCYEVDSVSFLKNGKRFLPVMGEFHFSRYEPEAWEEEILKMRSGGINIVATYVFWIHHEEKQGEWNFSGSRDLRGFLNVCKKLAMPVWLRIGPWAHGECRNGGFPDWLLQEDFQLRTDDPQYLELVKIFYGKISEQAKYMMCRDGGPVLGIQLENEYGHCGGPSDRTEGLAHMRTLKKLALKAGFDVPYYTATGWGGAYVAEREMLPVLGGYVDAPWAEHVQEMPASRNFLFSAYQQDENIGSDIGDSNERELYFDISENPYFTAELGGGLQVTGHRRTYPWPEDVEAQALCMLGSGANLLGYYMYHGGINPDGAVTTLQESRAAGYPNDLPVKSYDFQTCIRESGEISASYGRLKKLHLLLADFGEMLAGTDTYFAEIQPSSPEDMETLRVTARINHREGTGFLFVNNHQRKRRMEEHRDCSVRLDFGDRELVIAHITVKSGECAVLPFLAPVGWKESAAGQGVPLSLDRSETRWEKLLPEQTNASLLCRVGDRLFFYSDERHPAFCWKGAPADFVVLSREQADRAFRIGGHLYLTEHTDSCLIRQEGKLFLISKAAEEELTVYGPAGAPVKIAVRTEIAEVTVHAELVREQKEENGIILFREYQVQLGRIPEARLNQLYLEADYLGDRAEVFVDGRLEDDWFTTGEKWHIALRRFGYPRKLVLRIYSSSCPLPNPYGNQVYYDLPAEEGCELREVKALPEYKTEVVSGR